MNSLVALSKVKILHTPKFYYIFDVLGSSKKKLSYECCIKKAALEKQLAQIEKELKTIERSAAFKKENTISRALNNLMKKHGCSKNDLNSVLRGDSTAPTKQAGTFSSKTRKPRKLKGFKNPNNGETVETRGGNYKVLKAWKFEYNLDNIDEWLVAVKD